MTSQKRLRVGVLFGGLAERVLIRPLYGKPEINAIVVMVGFLGLIEAFVAGIWTGVTRNIPPPFSAGRKPVRDFAAQRSRLG